MKEKNFVVLIDALRHDFVDAERTPFLFELKRSATRATLFEPYTSDSSAAYLAGLEAKDSGTCFPYEYSPQASPFAFLRNFRPVCGMLERLRFDRFFRSAIRRYAESIERNRGRAASIQSTSTGFVPLQLLPFFSPRVKPSTTTIFDLFKTNGLNCTVISSQGRFETSQATAQKYAATSAADVAFVQFSELGSIGKHYGPRSMPVTKALRRIDAAVRRIVEPAIGTGGKALVFGNHGLVEVINRFDLRSVLAALPLRQGKDFVPFLDNTRAFFWFLHERARDIVSDALAKVPHGHILSEDELNNLNVGSDPSKRGELVFAFDGGTLINPSFSSPLRSLAKGMHGYLPSVTDNASQLIAVGGNFPSRDLGSLPMTQIYTLIREHLIPAASRNA